jgi:hypothetical protein
MRRSEIPTEFGYIAEKSGCIPISMVVTTITGEGEPNERVWLKSLPVSVDAVLNYCHSQNKMSRKKGLFHKTKCPVRMGDKWYT